MEALTNEARRYNKTLVSAGSPMRCPDEVGWCTDNEWGWACPHAGVHTACRMCVTGTCPRGCKHVVCAEVLP